MVGLKSGIFSCAEFPSQKACGRRWLLCCENYPLRSLELQASAMPSNLSPYQQQGWLASGHLNWSKIPGGPLAIPAPTSSGCFLWDSPDTLSLATLKPVSAVNELLGSSKTILTFLKGTENNKNKTPPKSLQFLTRSGLKKTKKTTKKNRIKAWKQKADLSFNNRTFLYLWRFLVWHKNICSFSGCYNFWDQEAWFSGK